MLVMKIQIHITLTVTLPLLLRIGSLNGNEATNISSKQDLDAKQSIEPFWLQKLELEPSNNSQKLNELLQRVGPNMRASSDYYDFTDIHLNESLEAWKLLQNRVESFAKNQVQFFAPKVITLFRKANVSVQCQSSINVTLQGIEKLESWAVQMWSASGDFPPTAFLAGDFTDLGSYRGCVDLKVPRSQIEFTSYCTLPYRPVVPTRPQFHQIFQRHDELIKTFSRSNSVLGELATRAQYFHYIYLRTGVCVPYLCSPNDMQQVLNLIARQLGLMTGPVKCFTRASTGTESPTFDFSKIENEPVLVEIERFMNSKQRIAGIILASFFGLVFLSTLWHILAMSIGADCRSLLCMENTEMQVEEKEQNEEEKEDKNLQSSQSRSQTTMVHLKEYNWLEEIAFNYFSLITNVKEFLEINMRNQEIRCLHGLRVLTMIWIIVVHTFQYNEWAGFFRAFETVNTLQNPFLHPIYNANYTVDNFFFMSGLLVAYTAWSASKSSHGKQNFHILVQFVGRYLRLTPQIFLISLLYMLLPFVGDSPFWYDMSANASWKCQKNWWINLLHIQSFYKEAEMCNMVSWYISVDMLFYVISLFLVYMILNKRRTQAFLITLMYISFCLFNQAQRHFSSRLTPNNLATVPQVNEVWSKYVVYFFWSPYPHAFSFFLGLWSGYLLANNLLRTFVRRWSCLGWIVCCTSLLLVNLSSHIWMSGAVQIGSQYISTAYNLIGVIIWSSAFGWIVIACHYGCAKWFDNLLSIKPFILLSKASFIIYLSHMLVVRMYFGLQNGLLEVSVFSMTYALAGNIFLSTVFGVFLCIAFEAPCLKFQKLITEKLKSSPGWKPPLLVSKSAVSISMDQTKKNGLDNVHKVTIRMEPSRNVLLK